MEKTKRIPVEGNRDLLRNKERLLLEVVSVSNGTVERHHVEVGTTRIEIYEDKLPVVLAGLRTEEDDALYAQAKAINDKIVARWHKDNPKILGNLEGEEREAAFNTLCPHRPERVLSSLLEASIPPFTSVKVVSRDEKTVVALSKYQEMSDDDKAAYLIDPPATLLNATERAAQANSASIDKLSRTIAKLMRGSRKSDSASS